MGQYAARKEFEKNYIVWKLGAIIFAHDIFYMFEKNYIVCKPSSTGLDIILWERFEKNYIVWKPQFVTGERETLQL